LRVTAGRDRLMKIGVIDAELLFHKSHRFPNLACMKIAGYWKAHGHDVKLLDSYEEVYGCAQVYISKVFTDTAIPEEVLRMPNVRYGGTSGRIKIGKVKRGKFLRNNI